MQESKQQAALDLSSLVAYERVVRGWDGSVPYPVEDFYLAADVKKLVADPRVTGNAQAALNDTDLRHTISNAIYSCGEMLGDHEGFVDAIARAILAASQQPAAAPKGHQNCHKCHGNSITHASFCQLFDSRQEQAALAQSSAATPPTPPQEAAARDDLLNDALIDAVVHLASEASGYTISEANLREASYKWLAAQV